MNENDLVSSVTVKFSTEGADKAKSDIQGVASAQDKLNASSENVATVSEDSAKRQISALAAYNRVAAAVSAQERALNAFAKAQMTTDRALAQGSITQDQAARTMDLYAARIVAGAEADAKLGASHAGLSTQAMSLGHAIRSSVEELAMGIPVSQVMAQQISHLSYAASGEDGLAGAFGEVKTAISSGISALGGFLTPLRLVAGGAVALGAAAVYVGTSWAESQRKVEQSLLGIGERSGNTVADINNFAKANASATGLSVDQARDVAVEFTKTGNIAVSGLKGVGDAIHGFSVITGKDATQAAQTFAEAFGGDLVKGAETLDKAYGVLDSGTLEYIRTLELQGDRTKAMQVIIDAMAPDNLKAADSVGVLSKAWSTFGNVLSSIKNAPAAVLSGPQPKPTNSAELIASGGDSMAGANAFNFGGFDKQFDELQQKANSFDAGHMTKEMVKISNEGDAVVRSIVPQIGEINNLQMALQKLQLAQSTEGVSRGLGSGQDTAAATAIQNQIAALKDSQAEAERYNQRVADIAAGYEAVSQKVKLIPAEEIKKPDPAKTTDGSRHEREHLPAAA